MTRLQRVTFLTAHKYLGLKREVAKTEKAINELACYPIPEILWETGAINTLLQHVKVEHEAGAKDLNVEVLPEANNSPFAGDLSSSFSSSSNFPTSRSEESTDNTSDADVTSSSGNYAEDKLRLREAIMVSISKAIGLPLPTSAPPTSSINASPMLHPQDAFRQKAVFNSSFGSLSFLGLQGKDDDSSSVTGSSIASASVPELENEVEILYFARGAVLATAGEKDAGLHFVIEGFLDVSIPNSSTTSDSLKSVSSESDRKDISLLFCICA